MDEQELGWLVRDTGNRIRGPFKQAEIVQMIKKGQLRGKAEIARANSYWFAIEEKPELARFFPEFNGGKPPPEQPTQMTATLTEADIQDHGIEVTTFTKLDPQKSPAPAEGGQIEWLSDEFAEEFGEDFGTTISVQLDTAALKEATPAEAPAPATIPDQQPTPTDGKAKADEKAKQNEMLRRATVKADTLPSEHKSFQGDRPKPIDTLMRNPGKPGASAIKDAHHATVSVPVEDGPAPKMIHEEDETKLREVRRRRNMMIVYVVAIVVAVGASGYFVLNHRAAPKQPKVLERHVRRPDEATSAARLSLLALDLTGTKSALSDLQEDAGARTDASTYLIEALENKEILGKVEDAMVMLQTARSQAKDRATESEIDNLMAIYTFDHEPAASLELLKRNADANRSNPVFRYNLALGYLRTNKQVDAIPLLDSLVGVAGNDKGFLEDVAVAQGWALESHCAPGVRDAICRRSSEAEDAYTRALTANPSSAKARLGLALFRLRRQGIKPSEADFRAFIDLAPELDPPSRVQNFRKLGNGDFYAFAHGQIVDLNNQNTGKPSPIVMAADGVISCIVGRTDDAGPILQAALGAVPGDVNVEKAIGFRHWKLGELNNVVEALKDLRDRGSSFAENLMLGKSFSKLNRRDLAEKSFHSLIENYPDRSEGYSLLGELLAEQPERAEEAKAQFQAALKRDPLDLVALRGLLRFDALPPPSAELLKNLPF
jgi:tetratricopeptide (TPR) repeat protein